MKKRLAQVALLSIVLAAAGLAAPMAVHFSRADSGEMTDPFAHERTNTPKRANATVGRYLYLGDAPRFGADDLELTLSKMGLTLRAKAYVKTTMPGEYLEQLLTRWTKVREAFQNESMSFETLQSAEQLADRAKTVGDRAWVKIAAQYMGHVLEDQGVDINSTSLTRAQYRDSVLTAAIRFYLQEPSATIERGVTLANQLAANPNDPRLKQLSVQLFHKHLGNRFTPDTSRDANTAGFLTFVYPIAATVEGPFDQPREALVKIGYSGSIESRWWSNKWDDEFGGMPFLLVDESGVAFHGPITNKSVLDVWFLRRGFVSHGCHRMDSSDILELRNILPEDFFDLVYNKKKRGIPTAILDWPDVTDVDGDGKVEAIDVAYYDIPTGIYPSRKQTADDAAVNFMGEKAKKNWWKAHYTRYNSKLSPKTPLANRFDADAGTFFNIPKYEIVKGKLVRNGVHAQVPIRSLPTRPGSILQYREAGVNLYGFDDRGGKYPPAYFH